MIKYVPYKPIRYDRIKELLALSEQAHIFTNNGPVKQKLEQHLHKKLNLPGSKRVACTSNATSALYILMSLIGSKHQDTTNYWINSAFTFPAAVVNKLKTKIVDIISPSCPAPSIEKIELHNGVILTTLFGTIPSNFEEIENYCQKSKRILILDNASSPLSSYKGKNINEYGTATIGSLHQTKYLGVGEAGFAVLPSELYDEFNYLCNFGFDDNRNYNNFGSNAKMSDISAAFVLSHIETYDVESHIKVQNKYIEALKNIPRIKVMESIGEAVYGNMPIIFDSPTSHLTFKDVGIEANKYYKPLLPLPNSQYLFDRIVNFPLYSTLTDYELGLILKKIEIEAKK